MRELRERRLLEGDDAPRLRADACEDVANRPVFARGVESLQHQQERPLPLSGKPVLQCADTRHQLGQPLEAGLFVGQVEPVAGVTFRKSRGLARHDTKRLHEIPGHAGTVASGRDARFGL